MLGICLLATKALCTETHPDFAIHEDLVYAHEQGVDLHLDLYMPKEVENPSLLIFLHGGGWRKGSYKKCGLRWVLTGDGERFAVASVQYRLSDQAIFPAQIHDVKGAVRWLRANAAIYGYKADYIGVAGFSAGGHLALLLATTGGNEALEGSVGGNLDQSSRVQAVASFYGPTDLVQAIEMSMAYLGSIPPPLRQLLGGEKLEEILPAARQASPLWHVSGGDPPLILFQGTHDLMVWFEQALRMRDTYEQHGLKTDLVAVPNAGHGGKAFRSSKIRQHMRVFFAEHLKDCHVSKSNQMHR